MNQFESLRTKVVLGILVVVAAATFTLKNRVSSRQQIAPLFAVGKALAAEQSQDLDKTLSPYFFVKSDDPDIDQLPLKSTSVSVDIAGVIADVKVNQVYKNEGKKPLEAIYIFPASTKAAVYAMKMTIGDRTITAQVRKREEARRAYEQAKQEGRSASLLEQQRPNVFQMNVANILPGDEIRTELCYTELITPTDGIYEFVYPTVVGPRYSNQPAATAPPSEKWVQNPYLHEGESPTYTFDITTHLSAGMPIQEMTCTSHEVDIHYENPGRAEVKLAPKEKFGGNRDFILKYRLSGDHIESGLLLYEGDKEKFFLLMMQPPKRISENQIPPREYIFIVDVSGSMRGFPLNISKRLLKDLIGGLRPTDTFNVLLFAGGSQLMAESSLTATPENIRQAIDVIDRQRGGGGTELLPALERALALPRDEGIARTMIIVTDGYVSIETKAFDLIRKEIGNANFFTFGIGSSVNRYLIEGMARVGAGEPFVVTKPDEAPGQAEKFRKYIQSPLLTQIKLDFDGFEVYDVEPEGVPDVFAERPVIVFGKWRGQPEGNISLYGRTGEQPYHKTIDVTRVKPLDAHSALRYLWARSRIAQLGDYNLLRPEDKRVAQITDLGLQYNLLTAYTSFLAIDSEVRRKDGEVTTVTQPLPLPQGVSDAAVGNVAPASPVSKSLSFSGHYMRAPARELAGEESASQPILQKDKLVEAEGDKADEKKAGSKEERDTHLAIKEIVVKGKLSEKIVRKTVEQHLEEIKNCSRNVSQPDLQAKVVVKYAIDFEGKVKDVKIISPKAMDQTLHQCITEIIRKWLFPASGGKGETRVTLTFSFGSAANG